MGLSYIYTFEIPETLIETLENEEEVEVEEEKTSPPPPSEHQAGNCFYFDICGSEPDSPINEGKPRCICHRLVF
jgi:hypothetical protein